MLAYPVSAPKLSKPRMYIVPLPSPHPWSKRFSSFYSNIYPIALQSQIMKDSD